MKYTYKNTTGTTEIEVDEHFYELLVAMDNEEFNSDRKHSRRYPISLENCEYEGEWFADDTDLLEEIIKKEGYIRLREAMKNLTPEQRELIQKVYFDGVPATEIAQAEGVVRSSISHRLERAIKRLKKYLE